MMSESFNMNAYKFPLCRKLAEQNGDPSVWFNLNTYKFNFQDVEHWLNRGDPNVMNPMV